MEVPVRMPFGGRLNEHVIAAGWSAGEGLVLVPEVDVWLWSDSVHVAKAMGWQNMGLFA